ncbi:MAG: tyrosine-type recombinase/integrase [Pseudomonadota bacterium]
MRRLCKRAGVRHFGIHAIRRLTASIPADEGAPIKKIQLVLRHKNLSTTGKYTYLLSDLMSAMQVLERRENGVYVGRKEKAV